MKVKNKKNINFTQQKSFNYQHLFMSEEVAPKCAELRLKEKKNQL